MSTVQQFTPRTQVIAHTWRGQTYDLTGDLFSWTRSKSMSLGSFTVQLVPKRDAKGKTWTDKLMPMDYIEIRAAKNGATAKGELPIIMRGFIDAPAKNLQFSQSGGPSEPRISITGTDFTKVLNAWQILYLFTQNMFTPSGSKDLAAIAAQDAGFGLFANYRVPMFSPSINFFVTDVFNNIVKPVIKGLKQKNYPSFPDMTYNFAFPNLPINGLPVASYTGSYWNLLQYASSPPFGELFVRDEQSGPVLVGRMTPYKTIAGSVPKMGLKLPNSGTIEAVTGTNVQQSDQDLYTYFLTWAADAQIFGMTMPTFLPGLSNGVMTKNASLYGINPLTIDTPWISLAQSNGKADSAIKLASELNAWLIATMGDNQLFWSGTVSCHGDENLQIGTYRTIPSANQEFYIAQISDNYQYATNRWDATLQVVRGRDL